MKPTKQWAISRVTAGLGLLVMFIAAVTAPQAATAAGPAAATAYTRDLHFPNQPGFTFQNVSWVTLSPDGRELYVLQRGAPAVSVWSPNGQLLRVWPTNALGYPHSLRFQTLPDGSQRIWITDMAPPQTAGSGYGHCIKQFTVAGAYVRSIGVCGENSQGSGLSPVQFDKVTDIGFDSGGNAWVADGDVGGLNNRVLQINGSDAVTQVWSAPNNQPGAQPKQFNLPHALDVDACDRVWVADALNHRVQVIRTNGMFLQQLQCFGQDGVYGLRVRTSPTTGQLQLFTTSSPTSSPTGGTVRIFNVASQCSAALPVPNGCAVAASWPISLSGATSTAMLHAVDASPGGESLYFATLGGGLTPQRWLRVYLPVAQHLKAHGRTREDTARRRGRQYLTARLTFPACNATRISTRSRIVRAQLAQNYLMRGFNR